MGKKRNRCKHRLSRNSRLLPDGITIPDCMMIALRKCDSRTGLIPSTQNIFRLNVLRRPALSRLPRPCESLPAAVLLKRRTSIKIAIFRYQQFNIFDSLCQYNLCRFFKNWPVPFISQMGFLKKRGKVEKISTFPSKCCGFTPQTGIPAPGRSE